MTDIHDLFSGVCVIVDDAFAKAERTDKIWQIRESIEKKNIPVLAYLDLPAEEQVKHYKGLNFMILDWDINPIEETDQLAGVKMGGALETDKRKRIISFIKKLNEHTYIPIFIFSQQDVDTIKRHLSDAGLLIEDKSTNIFVKSKSELIDADGKTDVLFGEIGTWLKGNPSVYVLKEWENAAKSAKKDLFWSFSDVHHQWPAALKKASELDGADASHELGTLIFKNIIARTPPIDFDSEIVSSKCHAIGKDDIRKVLEHERYLKNDCLPDKPSSGCLFRVARGNGSPKFDYFLNIRPDCDIIRVEDPQLYCLKGKVITDETRLNFDKGTFIEKARLVYMPLVDDGKIIEFDLRELHLKQWSEFKPNRIGRILHPYITRIQQKYASYLQRQGVPGLPAEIFETPVAAQPAD